MTPPPGPAPSGIAAQPSGTPIEQEFSPEGVDLTLIRWMLSLTPLERLEVLQDWVDGLTELRNGRITES
jgi:hypothetical protein